MPEIGLIDHVAHAKIICLENVCLCCSCAWQLDHQLHTSLCLQHHTCTIPIIIAPCLQHYPYILTCALPTSLRLQHYPFSPPLSLALKNNHETCVALLKEHGAIAWSRVGSLLAIRSSMHLSEAVWAPHFVMSMSCKSMAQGAQIVVNLKVGLLISTNDQTLEHPLENYQHPVCHD